MPRRLYDTQRIRFPLPGQRAFTEEGQIVTHVKDGVTQGIVDMRTGQLIIQPRQQLDLSLTQRTGSGGDWRQSVYHNPYTIPPYDSSTFIGSQIEYLCWMSCDNVVHAYRFFEAEAGSEIIYLGQHADWATHSEIIVKRIPDYEVYFIGYNVTGDPLDNPSGFISRIVKKIDGEIVQSLVTNLTEWEAALTSVYWEDLETDQDIIDLFVNAEWGTPVGILQSETEELPWVYRSIFSADAYWIWGANPMYPVGSEPYQLNVFRLKREEEEE